MAEPFGVDTGAFDGGRLVVPRGELDAATVDQLIQCLSETPPGALVVVDLSRLTFMDSSGLGALVVAHTRAVRSGGTLVVSRPGPTISRLLEITGLDIWEAEWNPIWENIDRPSTSSSECD